MPLPRRSLLAALGLTLVAPAIVRTPRLLMPVRQPQTLHGLRIVNLAPPQPSNLTFEQWQAFTQIPLEVLQQFPPIFFRTGLSV